MNTELNKIIENMQNNINALKKCIENQETETKAECKNRLENYTIAEIKELGEMGVVKKIFSIGDEMRIPLKNGETLTVAIAGFDHDRDKNGNLIPITFTAVNVLEDGFSMDDAEKTLDNFYENLLPDEVKENITPVVKDGEPCRVFLHSEVEIFGKTIYSNDETGEQYPYYKNKRNRVKFKGSEECACDWWERSPYSDGSYFFCSVNSDGGADYRYSGYSRGVVAAFAI